MQWNLKHDISKPNPGRSDVEPEGFQWNTALKENKIRLTKLLWWKLLTRPSRKAWLYQTNQPLPLKIFQSKPELPDFHGKFHPGLHVLRKPGKPGLTRISILLIIFQSLVSVVQPWFTRVTRLLIRRSVQGCKAITCSRCLDARRLGTWCAISNVIDSNSTKGIP